MSTELISVNPRPLSDPRNDLAEKCTTGGPTSVRGAREPLWRAGATARTMLVSAAAQTWKVMKNFTPVLCDIRISAAVRISHA